MMTRNEAEEPKLTPAIVQDALTGRVLMLGYMDEEALERTRVTGEVHFWSRSRQRLWKKGETSGNTLALVDIKPDCDHDAWLVRAVPRGPTCHTGSGSCFGAGGEEPLAGELDALYTTILERQSSPAGTRSYVRQLLDGGASAVAEKIEEEAAELTRELVAASSPKERIRAEAADLLFHLLVGLAARGVTLADVEQELHRRTGTSGLDEKARRQK